jgi:hypothetical protein
MRLRRTWLLAGAAALALQVGMASADGDAADFGKDGFGTASHGLLNPRICERRKLSEEDRAYCDGIAGLSGRARYKATVLENLRRTNRPPVADLKLSLILPGQVKLDASGSTDVDGFLEHYTFALSDADTGESIAGPVTSREPYGDLEVPGGSLPPRMRASVIVEDDERATDTAELAIP